MNRDEFNLILAAVLEVLADPVILSAGAPSSVLYSGLMGEIDLGEYQGVEETLIRGGLVARRSDCLRITNAGLAVVRKIEEPRAGAATTEPEGSRGK